MSFRDCVEGDYEEAGINTGAYMGAGIGFVVGVTQAPTTTALFPGVPTLFGAGAGGFLGGAAGRGVGAIAQAAANTKAARLKAIKEGRPDVYKFGDMTLALWEEYQFGDVTRALLGCPRGT